MACTCGWIVALRVDSRVDNAGKVQDVLTKHGCKIKVRLGLHETSQDYCANYGLIVLHCCGSDEEVAELVGDLNAVNGVSAKSMGMDM